MWKEFSGLMLMIERRDGQFYVTIPPSSDEYYLHRLRGEWDFINSDTPDELWERLKEIGKWIDFTENYAKS